MNFENIEQEEIFEEYNNAGENVNTYLVDNIYICSSIMICVIQK